MHTIRTALIDADFIAYKVAAWAHDNQGDLHDVVERVISMTDEWMTGAFCTKKLLCYSCDREDNFRRDHYPLYKAHRTGDPPAMLDEAKRAIADMGQSVAIPRLEADDVMGILATNGRVLNPVIVTVDKDLRQIPGWHFNPTKEDFPVHLTEVEADYVFFMQWLTGDPTDGFKGIKGCGPAKAAKLLNTEVPWEDVCMAAYRTAGFDEEGTLAQARCARILRNEDFDSDNRVHIPWVPQMEMV